MILVNFTNGSNAGNSSAVFALCAQFEGVPLADGEWNDTITSLQALYCQSQAVTVPSWLSVDAFNRHYQSASSRARLTFEVGILH